MIAKKIIKAEKTRCVSGKLSLLLLLCFFFFSHSLFAQIFQSNDTKIFIGEETLITENFSQIQKPDSVHIYITAGTTVTGLHSDQNIAVIYLKKPEETKTHFAAKHSNTQKYLVQHTAKEEKPTLQKESIRESKHEHTILFSAHHSSAVAPTTSQNIKLLAFFPKEAKNNITTNATSKKLIFENINLVLLSVCLTANSIRSPPFV